MANDTNLNKDLNSTKTSSSPAHQHLEWNNPNAVVTTKSEHKKLDDLGMESARRAQNRFGINDQRTPDSTLFTK